MKSSGHEKRGLWGSLAKPGISAVLLCGLIAPGALAKEAPSVQNEIASITASNPTFIFDHPEEDGTMHKEDGEWIFASSGQPLRDVIKRITISMSARIRPEYSENFSDFNNSFDDDFDFASNRFRLGVGADLSDHTHLFIEAQNNSVWGDVVLHG